MSELRRRRRRVYYEIAAAAESGGTSRRGGSGRRSLHLARTSEILPVDLNSIMYCFEATSSS